METTSSEQTISVEEKSKELGIPFHKLFTIFPKEKKLFEEYNRLKKLVEGGNSKFQKQFEDAAAKINNLLAINNERLTALGKVMDTRKNGVPKPQLSEFYVVEATQTDGSKNKQETDNIDIATNTFDACVEDDLTVVMKKVSRNGETENSEIIFQYTKGSEKVIQQPSEPATPQEINVKDEFLGIKFKSVKFTDAQAFLRFLMLSGTSQQWMSNGKNYFWSFHNKETTKSTDNEYIVTSQNPLMNSGNAGCFYLMVENQVVAGDIKSNLFDVCENHTEPVPVYESDAKDVSLQLTDAVKSAEPTQSEPVSGIPYCEIDEAIEFLNKLDFDKFIHLLCIKKLYDENEEYRGENFKELIEHRLNKNLPIEYFAAKQLLPEKQVITWLARKKFLTGNYEPEKVTGNIIKLHDHCFGLAAHPFSCITDLDAKIKTIDKSAVDFNNMIEYWPCGYLAGINYTKGTINHYDNLLGYVVFCSPKSESQIFVSVQEYNSVNEASSPGAFKIYSSKENGHLFMVPNSPVKNEENKISVLKTVSLSNQLFIAHNADNKNSELISYSDFKNENDILYTHHKNTEVAPENVTQPEPSVQTVEDKPESVDAP